MATYHLGDRVRCTGTIEQTDGTNIDPTVAKAWHKTPAGTVTTLTYSVDAALIKSAVGIYYFDLDVDTAGQWFYGFYSTGTGKAASADTLISVLASHRSV
jgi:hypothetical protein